MGQRASPPPGQWPQPLRSHPPALQWPPRSAPTRLQVQTKLLTTALFSVIMLRKRLARPQVIALVLLMVGVILAQMKDGKENSILSAASGGEVNIPTTHSP